MSQIDPELFKNLHAATRRYRLNDPSIGNAEIAERLQLVHDLGDHWGIPNCCLFDPRGALVAIRTKDDEVSIFHMWQRHQRRMEAIAVPIE